MYPQRFFHPGYRYFKIVTRHNNASAVLWQWEVGRRHQQVRKVRSHSSPKVQYDHSPRQRYSTITLLAQFSSILVARSYSITRFPPLIGLHINTVQPHLVKRSTDFANFVNSLTYVVTFFADSALSGTAAIQS